MKVVGIIAEYNPFHNGHLYQLQEAKLMTGADYVVVVMSGNYTQRGAPAFLDKYTRAEMALRCGADLVLELPTYFASASAQYFARGAIDLLHEIGVVEYLSFGSECGDIQLLTKIATKITEEEGDFSKELKEYLRIGHSYPKAFSKAFSSCYPNNKEMNEAIMTPNNLLGVEYIKAIQLRKSLIQPTTIKREGSKYLDESLTSTKSSALAIRNTLSKSESLHVILEQVPPMVYELLEGSFESSSFIVTDDFSQLLLFQLRMYRKEGYTQFADVSESLSNRIQNQLPQYRNFTDFCMLIKTKENTYARISRCLLHIMLGITEMDFRRFTKDCYAHYVRMLGFRKDSTKLLKAIKEQSNIPLISKISDAPKYLNQVGLEMLEREVEYSQIYHIVERYQSQKEPYNEYTQNIIRI